MSTRFHRDSWPLLAIIGPTGAGKTHLALRLAREFDGEIVGCDSIQVYRGLDIGSAKPSPDELRALPHHLIDVVDPDEELSAAGYSKFARDAIAGIRERNRVPVVVGGTGFYLKALLEGLSPAPARDARLRRRLRETSARRPGFLHRFLRRYDPEAARRIHANDAQKLIRAAELTILAARPATQTQSAPRNALQGFAVLKLGLAPKRDLLYARLNARCARMFEGGLLPETEKLLAAGYAAESKALQSLGYKQAVAVLLKAMPVQEAVDECRRKTRQYAKRQMTWFRAERRVEWLAGFGFEDAILSRAIEISRHFLDPLLA